MRFDLNDREWAIVEPLLPTDVRGKTRSVGALGTRLAGTNNFISPGCAVPTQLGQCNMVQGVNGPAGYGAVRGEDATGHIKAYQVAPPALWGIEFHYKFD